MQVSFPSVEFFRALQEGLSKDVTSTAGVEPSEAYCGFSIDDQLFVVEFDGRTCAAVVAGGNPLDLDFVISGPRESWSEAIAKGPASGLAELIQSGSLAIESDDGGEAARAALPMLQAFFDQAGKQSIEIA
jgi:hypothetical protein